MIKEATEKRIKIFPWEIYEHCDIMAMLFSMVTMAV